MSWDGKERRRMNQEDHDLLLRIEENTKGIPEWQKSHEELDNKRFFWLFICVLVVASATGILPQILTHVKLGG